MSYRWDDLSPLSAVNVAERMQWWYEGGVIQGSPALSGDRGWMQAYPTVLVKMLATEGRARPLGGLEYHDSLAEIVVADPDGDIVVRRILVVGERLEIWTYFGESDPDTTVWDPEILLDGCPSCLLTAKIRAFILPTIFEHVAGLLNNYVTEHNDIMGLRRRERTPALPADAVELATLDAVTRETRDISMQMWFDES